MIRRLSGLAGVTLLVTSLSVFVTWPQARFLTSHIAAHHDAYFSIWRVGWIAHALATSPLHLFDANIFHPAAGTLAYSDATILEGLIGAPLFWAGAPPALVYNLLLFTGFIGSGIAMFVLARQVTSATGPSLLAAAVFTMLPYRIEHFMHLELQWAMFIPLTFWALHRAVDSASWRWGAIAGLFLWLQLLCCVYYGAFLALALLAFVPALVLTGPRDRVVLLIVPLAAAVVVSVALAIPFALPYLGAARELGGRTVEEIARYSASPMNYFSAPSLSVLWGWTADRFGGSELRLFPGAIGLLLAAGSLWRRPVGPVVVYVVTAAVAVELSFGLNGRLYPALLERVDALQGFRSLSRFAIIASCAIAVLAALGAEGLLARLRSRPLVRSAMVPLLLALTLVDYANRPMGLTPADPVEPPDVYKVLRRAAPGAVIELPVPDLSGLPGRDPFYEARSLWHWKPLVNGYSGYHPRDYLDTLLRMLSFPDDASIGRLRAHDVRYVVVHRTFYDQDQYSALMVRIAGRPEFKPWGAYKDVDGMAEIFELLPP